MNTTEVEIMVLQEAVAERAEQALRELNQLQLVTCGGVAGETILV